MAKASTPTTVFTWKIANLERETADGFVMTAHYTISAEDGTYSSGAYGSLGFERPDKLIPFADLTEEMVIGWVKDNFGAEKVTEIEGALQHQLDEQRHPTQAAGVPWQ
jgi:hypothetical protein